MFYSSILWLVLLLVLLIFSGTSQAELSSAELVPLRQAAEDRSKKKSNVVYFLHIHKAGGTTLCELASKNGLKRPGSNCLPSGGGGGRNWIHFGAWEIDEQVKWATKNQKFQLVANEFTPIVHLPPPGAFTYITCLRDPLDRILSHYKYVKIWFPKFRNGRHNFQGAKPRAFHWDGFLDFLRDDNRDEKQTGEIENRVVLKHAIYPNNFGWKNFQTHMFTNCKRDCDDSSLTLAKQRLEYFSVIIIIERWEETTAALKKLGWSNTGGSFTSKSHQNTHSNARKLLDGYPEEMALLTQANLLDIDLYDFANKLVDARLGK